MGRPIIEILNNAKIGPIGASLSRDNRQPIGNFQIFFSFSKKSVLGRLDKNGQKLSKYRPFLAHFFSKKSFFAEKKELTFTRRYQICLENIKSLIN